MRQADTAKQQLSNEQKESQKKSAGHNPFAIRIEKTGITDLTLVRIENKNVWKV